MAACRGGDDHNGRGVGCERSGYEAPISLSPSKVRPERGRSPSVTPLARRPPAMASVGSAELVAAVTGRLDDLETLLRCVAGEQAALKEAQRSTDEQVADVTAGHDVTDVSPLDTM